MSSELSSPPSLTQTSSQERSLSFSKRSHGRYFWHKWANADFIPPIYSFLSDSEWLVIESWYQETEKLNIIGESCIPFMSYLQGLIMGNRLSRVVQLGTYSGYSSLLIGFMLRHMGIKHGLFSADIDQRTTDFANKYVGQAGLSDYMKLIVCDSKVPALATQAKEYFSNQRPQLVIIDSSHQYAQTLVELDLWYDALTPGGFMVLHDTSAFAQAWDSTGQGGVKKAYDEWCQKNPEIASINIDCGAPLAMQPGSPHFVYQDGCGIGIVYKRKDR